MTHLRDSGIVSLDYARGVLVERDAARALVSRFRNALQAIVDTAPLCEGCEPSTVLATHIHRFQGDNPLCEKHALEANEEKAFANPKHDPVWVPFVPEHVRIAREALESLR